MNMMIGQEIPVLADFFKIHFIENPGAAFGLTIAHVYEAVLGIFMENPELSDYTAKMILSIFSVVAVGFIIYYLRSLKGISTALPIYVSMILGGAIGNIIDCVFYGVIYHDMNQYNGGFLLGWVVDMLYFPIVETHYPSWSPIKPGQEFVFFSPVFNLADAAISIGVVSIIIFQKRFFRQGEEVEAATEPATVEPANDTNNTENSENKNESI
jgi:signal peptidase II